MDDYGILTTPITKHMKNHEIIWQYYSMSSNCPWRMHMEICSEDAKFRHGIDQDNSGLIQINPETAKTRENQKKQ